MRKPFLRYPIRALALILFFFVSYISPLTQSVAEEPELNEYDCIALDVISDIHQRLAKEKDEAIKRVEDDSISKRIFSHEKAVQLESEETARSLINDHCSKNDGLNQYRNAHRDMIDLITITILDQEGR